MTESTNVVSDAESEGSRSGSTSAWSKRGRQEKKSESGTTTNDQVQNSTLKSLQAQLNDIKKQSDKEVSKCQSQIKEAAEQQRLEMEKIRSDQQDVTETLKAMTGTLQTS